MKKIIYIDNFLTGHGHTPTTGATLVRQFREEGYMVIPASSRNNKFARLLDMLYTILSNRKDSVVLIGTYSEQAFYFACLCALLCRILHIPYIPCLHGGHLPRRISHSPALSNWYFGHSYVNVAVSNYLRSCMTAGKWKSIEIPNNIPVGNYTFKCRNAAGPSLFWARSFHHNYNPDLAVKVLYNLRQKQYEATLTMAGPDKDDGSLERCKALAKDLGVAPYISFPGLLTQKEWTDMAAGYDIFINTSNIDNLPVSVIEAMALGMVIINTRVGGVPFLLEEGKTGLMVPPDDADAFVTAIEKVISNPALAAHLSKCAHKKAQEFDWKYVKLVWKQLFEEVSGSQNGIKN